MRRAKLHSNFVYDDFFLEAQSIWPIFDSREVLSSDPCDTCLKFIIEYRLEVEGVLVSVPEDYIVELDENYTSNDFTPSQWVDKMMEDELVKDGDYVKVWKENLGILDPVKDGADQADYNMTAFNRAIKGRPSDED